jgi:hypothetical protein
LHEIIKNAEADKIENLKIHVPIIGFFTMILIECAVKIWKIL